jgi:hypothetical protein
VWPVQTRRGDGRYNAKAPMAAALIRSILTLRILMAEDSKGHAAVEEGTDFYKHITKGYKIKENCEVRF